MVSSVIVQSSDRHCNRQPTNLQLVRGGTGGAGGGGGGRRAGQVSQIGAIQAFIASQFTRSSVRLDPHFKPVLIKKNKRRKKRKKEEGKRVRPPDDSSRMKRKAKTNTRKSCL
jgi:hypothetical protein